MQQFEDPLKLLLIFPVLILLLIPYFIRKRGISFTSINGSWGYLGWKSKLIFIPDLLLAITLILLVIIIAKPVKPPEEDRIKKDGIAIELVLDISGSMNDGLSFLSRKRKIDHVKEVVDQFVMGKDEGGNDARTDDLIGMVTFATYANTVYPLSFNRQPFRESLYSIEIPQNKEFGGTHFGAGLQTAIARLETLKEDQETNIRSKVIIFLTDGENRINDIDPLEMARLAKKKGIIIYTIAFATQEQQLLQYISQITNGDSFHTGDPKGLLKIYETIDSLEKSKLNASLPAQRKPDSFKYMIVSMILFMLSLIAEMSFFRRFP